MVEQQTSVPGENSQLNETARVHLIAPAKFTQSLYLSILPSFLCCLPPSIHSLRITFVFSLHFSTYDFEKMPRKLSDFSLTQWLENAVENVGVANLCFTFDQRSITVTFGEVKEPAIVNQSSEKDHFTRTFPFLQENHSEAVFIPIGLYSFDGSEYQFFPITDDSDDKSPSIPLHRSSRQVSTIQLSFCATPGVTLSPISRLPVELLSRIFHLFIWSDLFHSDSQYRTLADVCQYWRHVSIPFWAEPALTEDKHARLKLHPGAGLFWSYVKLDKLMSAEMACEVIMGSPNIVQVWIGAFWDEEHAGKVLDAIAALTRLDDVIFISGSRKWKKDEIENFLRRTSSRKITYLHVAEAEDSPSSCSSAASPSEGLQLPSTLTSVNLLNYPPVPSLVLPRALSLLHLINMCPLPAFISASLPYRLSHLKVRLAPFLEDDGTSTLTTPLDLPQLTQLTDLCLDGGADTSNLVPYRLFRTLKNAKGINRIQLDYCVMDSLDFPDFTRWFFGDRREDESDEELRVTVYFLRVDLFFGGWLEQEIIIARRTVKECAVSQKSDDSWVRECGVE